MKTNLKIVAVISIASAFSTANYPAASLAMSLEPSHQVSPEQFWNLYESEFAIWRIQRNDTRGNRSAESPWTATHVPVGMGFVIRQNPLLLLTCYHVVSEGSESNSGNIVFAIGRRIKGDKEFNLLQAQVAFLLIKRILFKPEYDLAILEVDPTQSTEAHSKLDLGAASADSFDIKSLDLDFDPAQRAVGTSVMWSTTGSPTGDQTHFALPPRFFTANIVTNYVTNVPYSAKSASGVSTEQTMTGVRMFEVDKLMLPGTSGSAIVNVATNRVIG